MNYLEEQDKISLDYIKWLIEFMKDKEYFSDDEWDYSSEKLNEFDQEKVNQLHFLFEGILRYAKENYIYPTVHSLGESFQIKINDNIFEIGYITGQGTSFYCRKISLYKAKEAINYMDIVNNIEQDHTAYFDYKLERLSALIKDLYHYGVPIEAMIETVNNTINNIDKDKKEKTKTKEL